MSATEPNMASGLAVPVPAMSGAVPCTGSNRPGPEPSPSDALGSIPSEPVSIAASSLRMSPNMFSVSKTSNSAGLETSCMAALSTSMCSSGVSSPAAMRSTVLRHRREVSRMLALSTLVTLRRASRNATRVMRSISASL
jgi:hypothetical protein